MSVRPPEEERGFLWSDARMDGGEHLFFSTNVGVEPLKIEWEEGRITDVPRTRVHEYGVSGERVGVRTEFWGWHWDVDMPGNLYYLTYTEAGVEVWKVSVKH